MKYFFRPLSKGCQAEKFNVNDLFVQTAKPGFLFSSSPVQYLILHFVSISQKTSNYFIFSYVPSYWLKIYAHQHVHFLKVVQNFFEDTYFSKGSIRRAQQDFQHGDCNLSVVQEVVRFDWVLMAQIPYRLRMKCQVDQLLPQQYSYTFKFQQSNLDFNQQNTHIKHQIHFVDQLYPLTINILMIKSTILPRRPEEKEGLIKRIQQEIIKICPDSSKTTPQVLQKKAILEERIKLINNCQEYEETRLSNLQKIFKHYSTHLFRSGQKYDFDQIGYLNEHLIIQRFFAFINDFKLNEILINGEPKTMAQRNDIILLFKKSSSNARNLDFPEFIACLERLFVLLFNQNQGYKGKQQRLQKQKQERALQAKKRQKLKQERLKLKQKMIKMGIKSPLLMPTKVDNPQLKSLAKPQVNLQAKPIKQNDQMINEMMKDFQIVNPTEQIKIAVKQVVKQNKLEDLYSITDAQKIESYLLRIGIDDKKQIEKKLRYFQKANFRYFQVEQLNKYRQDQPKKRDEEKGNQPLNLKRELTSMHDQWKNGKKQLQKSNADRFISVVEKLGEREVNKSKLHMSRSLSRQSYDHKRKRMDEKFTKRQLDLMYPTAKQRISKKKYQEQSTVYYNLQMLHHSSPNQLPINKVYPDRYVSSDPTDSIFLQQYSFPRNIGGNRALSSLSRDKSDIAESTKRRANQLQNQQAKRISRLTINLHQNHHYLQKFLERKW